MTTIRNVIRYVKRSELLFEWMIIISVLEGAGEHKDSLGSGLVVRHPDRHPDRYTGGCHRMDHIRRLVFYHPEGFGGAAECAGNEKRRQLVE